MQGIRLMPCMFFCAIQYKKILQLFIKISKNVCIAVHRAANLKKGRLLDNVYTYIKLSNKEN